MGRTQKAERRRQNAEGRWHCLLPTAYCLLALSWFCGVVWAEDLPLPKDVKNVSPPHEALMGERPVTIQGFSTQLTVDGVREFYLKALPKSGWKLAPLPWLVLKQRREEAGRAAAAQQADAYAGLTPHEKIMKVKQQLEQVKQEHPEVAQSQEFVQQSAKLDEALELLKRHPEMSAPASGAAASAVEVPHDVAPAPAAPAGQNTPPEDPQLEEMKRRQLYAERGTDRVLLHFTPQRDKTLVFMNRWEESGNDGAGGGAAQDGAPTGWPAINPCCGDLEVPEGARKLPNSVPRYPNGRLISTGTAPAAGSSPGSNATEVYLTGDTIEEVRTFYRTQMAFNGWSEKSEPGPRPPLDQVLGEQTPYVNSGVMMFRQNRAMCVIVASEYLSEKALAAVGQSASQQPGSASAPSVPLAEEGKAARTVIVVSFVDSVGSGVPHGANR